MSALERREELISIMIMERSSTVPLLATRLQVCENTIRNDLHALTVLLPIQTKSGRGGGVLLPESYHPHTGSFTSAQCELLERLMAYATEEEILLIYQLLAEYGSAEYRIKYAKYR